MPGGQARATTFWCPRGVNGVDGTNRWCSGVGSLRCRQSREKFERFVADNAGRLLRTAYLNVGISGAQRNRSRVPPAGGPPLASGPGHRASRRRCRPILSHLTWDEAKHRARNPAKSTAQLGARSRIATTRQQPGDWARWRARPSWSRLRVRWRPPVGLPRAPISTSPLQRRWPRSSGALSAPRRARPPGPRALCWRPWRPRRRPGKAPVTKPGEAR